MQAHKLRAIIRRGGGLALLATLIAAATPAWPANIAVDPHEALYTLTLESVKSASGVVGANGAMFYKWGETCDGWTLEQRFHLRISYAEEDATDISSTVVT